jgi:imidazolonepropionase-like amidohydrolase
MRQINLFSKSDMKRLLLFPNGTLLAGRETASKPKTNVFFGFLLISVLCFLPIASAQENANIIAITGGTLIDGTGTQPLTNRTIIIKGDMIVSAGPSASTPIPENATVIDARGKWILPGFIELHHHLGYGERDNSMVTLAALERMNQMLSAGVTSIRDVGAPVEPMRALKEAQERGIISSLRLFPCGNLITTTGGHGDSDWGQPDNILTMTADGPWEFRKAVRLMHKAGFDHIKISPPFTLEEVKAAVDEARIQNMRITAHGGGVSDTEPPSMTRVAIEGGVQCIEHPPMMDEGTLELMANKGVYWVPTIGVYLRQIKEPGFHPMLINRGWSGEMHEKDFRKGKELGILMGIGTDYVAYQDEYPGLYIVEMKTFVDLGYTPMEAIVCATKNGAIILGHEDKLGTIEAGKLADLQIIKDDPLKSFDALGHPEIVMVGGTIHRYK